MEKRLTESSGFWIAIVAVLIAVSYVFSISDSGEQDTMVPREGGATVGDALETNRGVSVELRRVDYSPSPPESLFLDDPLGQFVAIDFYVSNDSNEPITVYRQSLEGAIGSKNYQVESLFSSSAEAELLREVNPGLSAGFTAYIDIPIGETLDQIVFDSPGWGTSLIFNVTE